MPDLLHTPEELTASQRELADMLDLAIAAGAPFALLEKLAAASGLLRALSEVPSHALVPEVMERSRKAARAFRAWQEKLPNRVAA